MREPKLVSRPWEPQDLLDDLQRMIDELPDHYLNDTRTTLCMARDYLKAYFDTGLEPEQIIRARDTLECFDNIGIKRGNAPLTYDELQQMKYEPVWIVWPDGRIKSRWWLVGRADWYMMGFDCRKDYGKVWIAYRKKEEETRNDVEN